MQTIVNQIDLIAINYLRVVLHLDYASITLKIVALKMLILKNCWYI